MIVGDGSPDWGSASGTISFWVKWDAFGVGPTRPRLWGQHADMELLLSTYSDLEGVQNRLWVDWGSTITIESNTNFTIGNWYFVAIVWNEGTDELSLYVGDATLKPALDTYDASWTGSVSTVGVTENNFLSSSGGVAPTDGQGDDLRYWNTDWSLSELQGDYDRELTGSEPNLQSYFPLNNAFDDLGASNDNGSGSGSYIFSEEVPMDPAPSENLNVDVWNGLDWDNLLNDLASGWNNVSISSYLTDATFTIRFSGTDESDDTIQDSWDIDASLIFTMSSNVYDYILQIISHKTFDQNIRLKLYDSSNINRLTNCTLWLHDGSTSAQIIIIDGSIVLDIGTWYLLPAGQTRYLAVEVAESSAGISLLSIELEAIESGTIIYTAIMELRVE
jgi:hypothetical protein